MVAQKPAAERRSFVRRQPTVGTVCKLEPRGGVGLVWNISTGGVSMLLCDSREPGASIRGVLATATEEFFLPVNVRVTHVAPIKTGDYLVGGQFDPPIAADEIKHFLPA